MSKKVNFESFNKGFFQDSSVAKDLKWFGLTGILPINKTTNAEIALSTNGTHGNYAGYRVRITNKETGEIAKHFFEFNDYMRAEKEDSRCSRLQIIESCCEDTGLARWYIIKPSLSAVHIMAEKMIAYIKMWNTKEASKKHDKKQTIKECPNCGAKVAGEDNDSVCSCAKCR